MGSHSRTKFYNRSVLLGLLVTILWSSSWVLIKLSLDDDLPALTFAGLRYTLAFLCLSPLVLLDRNQRKKLVRMPRSAWFLLFLFGIVCFTIAQGALFLALQYIPAAMTSLLLNLTPVAVGISGMFLLREYPTKVQWMGILVSLVGVFIYFRSMAFQSPQIFGTVAALICVLANTGSSIIGRHLNSKGNLTPITITFVSMGFGSTILFATGLTIQGIGVLDFRQWCTIIWLAVVNTALAWNLWNHTLRVLTAVESSILNTLMLPQTALLAVIFLGEKLSLVQVIGLALVGSGAVIVQLIATQK